MLFDMTLCSDHRCVDYAALSEYMFPFPFTDVQEKMSSSVLGNIELDADHDFRAELQNAFLTNEVAAPRMARLILKAHNCKVSGLSTMVKIAKSSKQHLKTKLLKHMVKKQ